MKNLDLHKSHLYFHCISLNFENIKQSSRNTECSTVLYRMKNILYILLLRGYDSEGDLFLTVNI